MFWNFLWPRHQQGFLLYRVFQHYQCLGIAGATAMKWLEGCTLPISLIDVSKRISARQLSVIARTWTCTSMYLCVALTLICTCSVKFFTMLFYYSCHSCYSINIAMIMLNRKYIYIYIYREYGYPKRSIYRSLHSPLDSIAPPMVARWAPEPVASRPATPRDLESQPCWPEPRHGTTKAWADLIVI